MNERHLEDKEEEEEEDEERDEEDESEEFICILDKATNDEKASRKRSEKRSIHVSIFRAKL